MCDYCPLMVIYGCTHASYYPRFLYPDRCAVCGGWRCSREVTLDLLPRIQGSIYYPACCPEYRAAFIILHDPFTPQFVFRKIYLNKADIYFHLTSTPSTNHPIQDNNYNVIYPQHCGPLYATCVFEVFRSSQQHSKLATCI